MQRSRAAAALKAIRAERYQATHKGELARQKILRERDARLERQVREREEFAARRAATAKAQQHDGATDPRKRRVLGEGIGGSPSPVPRASGNTSSLDASGAVLFLSPSDNKQQEHQPYYETDETAVAMSPEANVQLHFSTNDDADGTEAGRLMATVSASPRDDEVVFDAAGHRYAVGDGANDGEGTSPPQAAAATATASAHDEDTDDGSPVFRVSLA